MLLLDQRPLGGRDAGWLCRQVRLLQPPDRLIQLDALRALDVALIPQRLLLLLLQPLTLLGAQGLLLADVVLLKEETFLQGRALSLSFRRNSLRSDLTLFRPPVLHARFRVRHANHIGRNRQRKTGVS